MYMCVCSCIPFLSVKYHPLHPVLPGVTLFRPVSVYGRGQNLSVIMAVMNIWVCLWSYSPI